jgi:hypothetical protein
MGAVYSAFNIVVEAMTEPESSDLEKSGKESRKISLSDNNTDTSTSIVYVNVFD